MSDDITTNEGVTRREALKKGARLGGALVWAVPVVQTVGMSSAMAQTVSEGRCCLRISLSDPVYDGVDLAEFSWSVLNCGTSQITNVRGFIDISSDGGASWANIVTDNKGTRNAGSPAVITNEATSVSAGVAYLFRMHGTFDCDNVTGIWHSVPGNGVDSYIVKGLVVP